MRRFLFGCLAAIALSVPVTALAGFSNMYVFGDSLSDNGNLYGWTGAPNPVTGATPIPLAPPYSPGRFQNGPSYAELLWNGLQSSGHLQAPGDLTPRGVLAWPLVGSTPPPAGTNYAVGGARSRYHRFDVPTDSTTGQLLPPVTNVPLGATTFYPFSLRGQFEQFTTDVGGSADPNALFVVWSGSNDVGDALLLYDPTALDPFADVNLRMQEALQDVGAVLGGLVAAGADYLLVPNVPDLGLIPELNWSPQASFLATSLSAAYNAALNGIVGSLSSSNPNLTLYSFDTFGLLQQVTSSPGSFGFNDVTNPCLQGFFVGSPTGGPISVCSNPDEYVFWDINHPTARTHQILAAGMLREIPEPGTWLLVGLGLVASCLVGTGRRTTRAAGTC